MRQITEWHNRANELSYLLDDIKANDYDKTQIEIVLLARLTTMNEMIKQYSKNTRNDKK